MQDAFRAVSSKQTQRYIVDRLDGLQQPGAAYNDLVPCLVAQAFPLGLSSVEPFAYPVDQIAGSAQVDAVLAHNQRPRGFDPCTRYPTLTVAFG